MSASAVKPLRVFCLVKVACPVADPNPTWLEDCGDCWYDDLLDKRPDKNPSDRVLRYVIGTGFDDLDWSVTGLIKPGSDAGWLSPAGRFFGCSYMDHDLVAHYVLHKSVGDLEAAGWIRVPGDGGDLYCQRFPTAEQLNWAAMHDHLIVG